MPTKIKISWKESIWLLRTHINQRAVKIIGNAINCLNVSIHKPGLGRKFKMLGKIESIIYGKENPIPKDKKIKKDENPGCKIAKPNAEPINGAVQGVATITARKPVPKEFEYPEELTPFGPILRREFKKLTFKRKKPARKIKRKINKLTTKGDWSLYPQPISIPKYFKKTTDKPIKINIKIAPDENDRPWRVVCVLFSEWFIKFKIFKEITGKTQGIKFSKSPPIRENNIAVLSEIKFMEDVSRDLSWGDKNFISYDASFVFNTPPVSSDVIP